MEFVKRFVKLNFGPTCLAKRAQGHGIGRGWRAAGYGEGAGGRGQGAAESKRCAYPGCQVAAVCRILGSAVLVDEVLIILIDARG